MTSKPHPLDAAFLEKQRNVLLELRASLVEAVSEDESDESAVKGSADGPREYEEDAQRLDALELDGNLVARNLDRLETVNRALRKIEDGTYGASDVSGQLIARERLEAVPEAVCTLAEEQAREAKG